MTPPKVALIACGAFNPVTNMHLRMFELARDNLQKTSGQTVVCGIISPVHDDYKKKDLIGAKYRSEMLRLAVKDNNWIKVSKWECQQEAWSRTRLILEHHQNQLNKAVNDKKESPNKKLRGDQKSIDESDDTGWIPDLKNHGDGEIQLKLLCGADLLESFGERKVWADEDVAEIVGKYGIVVITREGTNPYKFIYESDVLTKFQNNITIVTEWITNDVSSTKVRRCLRRNESVKYLIPDRVIDYIKKELLYGAKDKDQENKTIHVGKPSIKENLTLIIEPMGVGGEKMNDTSRKTVDLGTVHVLETDWKINLITYLPISKYLYPITTDQQNYFLTPSPSDVNMESPSPTAQFDFTQNARNLENSFGIPLIGPKISLTYMSVNDVDGRCTTTVKEDNSKKTSTIISYPGQAVQIIKTASGENEVYNQKVRIEEKESPVANVQIQITKDGIKVISDKETTV